VVTALMVLVLWEANFKVGCGFLTALCKIKV